MNQPELQTEKYLMGWAITLLLSLWSLKILYVLHTNNWDILAQTALSITDGSPPWRAFQNRLMGAYSVWLLTQTGMSDTAALLVFTSIAFLIHNCILYHLLRKTKINTTYSVIGILVFCFAFVSIQHFSWLYVWDVIEITIVSIWFYIILFGKSWTYLIPLCLIATLNKETAIWISAFMIMDSLEKLGNEKTISLNYKKLITGILLSIFIYIYTQLAREHLFDPAAADKIWDDIRNLPHTNYLGRENPFVGNHLHISQNIRAILNGGWGVLYLATFIYIPLLISFLAMAKKLPGANDRQIKATLSIYMMFTSVLLFGLLEETRQLLPLITAGIFYFISCQNSQRLPTGSANSALP